MSKRRLRPVAALTLAIVAAPFLAATAVAAQANPASTDAPEVVTVTWPTRVAAVVDRVEAAADDAARQAYLAAYAAAEAEALAAAKAAYIAAAQAPPPPTPDDASSWAWPANGPVTSPFGARWGRMHEGVDIDAAHGSAVVAGHQGTVVTAGWGQSGYGLVVEIDHGNGLLSRYAHLSAVHVAVGQVVDRAQLISAVGATGSVTAAHLRYEVRQGGVARNPAGFLPAGGASLAGNPG